MLWNALAPYAQFTGYGQHAHVIHRRETYAVPDDKWLWEALDGVHSALPEHEREAYQAAIRALAYGSDERRGLAKRWLDQFRLDLVK